MQIVARVLVDKFTCHPRPRFREPYNAIGNASKAHVAQNTGEQEWYTPTEYLEPARAVLGTIDLDPATSHVANEVVQASQIFTADESGLEQPWNGRIWMNPPYTQPLITQFCEKLAASVRAGTVPAAIVLVNNATETRWFRMLADVAAAICFPTGRVRFWSPDKESATPLQGQALIYIGTDAAAFRAHYAGIVRCRSACGRGGWPAHAHR